MKKYYIVLAVLVGLAAGAAGQTDVDLDPEVGARLGITLDKQLNKRLHVRLDEELRMDENFSAFDRIQGGVGLYCRMNSHLKFGAGYTFIKPFSSKAVESIPIRHRFSADVVVGSTFGDWRVTLRERVQATIRTDSMNTYQAPRTAWALKSRVKATYKGFSRWQPYGSVELRNTLNAPVVVADYSESAGAWVSPATGLAKNEAGWFLDGFSGVYVNRVRGMLGVEYSISFGSAIDVSLLADWNIDKKVDANAEGTKLKSYTREQGLFAALVVSYKVEF